MKKWIKVCGMILTILSFVFIAYKLYNLDLDRSSVKPDGRFIFVCLLGLVLSVASVYLLAFIWARPVMYFAARHSNEGDINKAPRIGIRSLIGVYCRANIGKYLPGNVFQYVERNLFLENAGISQFEIAMCSVLEIVSLLLAGLFLGIILGFDSIRSVFSFLLTKKLIILVPIAVIVLCAVFFILHKKSPAMMRSFFTAFRDRRFVGIFFGNLLLHMLALLLIGSIIVLVFAAITENPPTIAGLRTIMSAYVLSWLSGFVVIGSPGGIGVREAVLSLITASSGFAEIILISAVIQRIITIIGDVIPYILTLFHRPDR